MAPDRPATPVEEFAAKQHTHRDDWDTEAISESASQQLAQLQHWLVRSEPLDAALLGLIAQQDVSCGALRPSALREAFSVGTITVHRPPPGWRETDRVESFSGVGGLQGRLTDLLQSLGDGGERRVKFKLFRIDRRGTTAVSSVRYEASSHQANGSLQQTATWRCEWSVPHETKELPKLRAVELVDFEEVRCTQPGGSLFVDCTQSVLGSNASYESQVLVGINQWLDRISREFLGQFGHHGVAVGDVNGDGLDDLYVCDAGGLPNRLFVQQPDGTAVDRSHEAGVDLLEDSVGALLVDFDNDGDQDLVVGTDPLLQFAENDGRGNFTWRARMDARTDTFSLCAADYDQDGDLDLYVCGYNVRKQDPTHRGLPFPVPYHDANNGGRNLLLRNDGAFAFADATAESGLDVNNSRFSMAASWEDFDNDGDADLYVANDFGRNNLFRNDGGRFTDLAAQAGVEDHGSGMSVDWGDYDRDGRLDLYVGNMFSAAGNRVTYQRRFSQGRSDDAVSQLQRMARGNTLFRNVSASGRAEFLDVTNDMAVSMGRWAWASKFADLTNDGWLDLVIANGYVTNEIQDDL